MENKISLKMALLININIMIGAGVFINPAPLTRFAGYLGSFSYLMTAIIILPLVLALAQLARLHPNAYGGLYEYGKMEIGPLFGVLSVGSYFIGKAISCGVLSLFLSSYLKNFVPHLAAAPTTALAIGVLVFLTVLNIFGFKIGPHIQVAFITFKLLPILFVIFFGYALFNPAHFVPGMLGVSSFAASLPIALYALLGFESCCAIGRALQNPERDLGRAVLYSFLIAAIIYAFFQFFLFGAVGSDLIGRALALTPFSEKFTLIFPVLGKLARPFFNSAIMVSALGGAFGIFFTNTWNCYRLICELGDNAITRFLTAKNRKGLPTRCVFIQAAVGMLAVVGGASLTSLQFMTVLGVVIAYLISACALVFAYRRRDARITLPLWVAIAGLVASLFIAVVSIAKIF